MGRLNLHARFIFLLLFISHFVHAAEVESFSPSGEVKGVRQVVARFAEQMVAFGDLREVAPFDIACPAAGRGRWADQRNWIYDFDDDLPAGISCTFTLKEGLTTTDGKPVKGGERFFFNTGGPAIVQSEPSEGEYAIDENQAFVLGLDAPATAESITQNAACLVEGIRERIPVRLITGEKRKAILDQRGDSLIAYYSALFKRGRYGGQPVILRVEERGTEREKFLKLRDGENSPVVVLQCRRTLPNSAWVRLVWGKGISSVSGIPATSAQTISFRTREVFDARFSCERTNKDAGCIPVLPMSLAFSAPVRVADARKIRLVGSDGKSVRALISKEDRKSGFVQYLSFSAPLPARTGFRLELPAGLKDDAGRTLANASSFPLAVRTDDNPPLAKFAARFGILELNASPVNASPAAPPLLPVTLRNVEPKLAASLGMAGLDEAIDGQAAHVGSEMEVIRWLHRLQKIDAPSFLADREDRDYGPGKTSIFEKHDKRKSFKLAKPLGGKAFEVVGIPLDGPGFHVVELESPKLGKALHGEKRPYYVHAAALVTNLSVHFKQGRESSLVWVTSLDQGLPVADAAVAVRDCSGRTHYQGRTDSRGILRIEKELPATQMLPPCTGEYDRQYFVTARSGRDFSFVLSDWDEGIALWRFNVFQNAWEGHDVAHAVLDRTLLRAGETVHIKLFWRRQTRAGFAAPDAVLPATINIEHQGGEEKYQVPVKWDAQGIAAFDWQIPKDAKQGSYEIQIPAEGHGAKSAGEFRVESFRVLTMKAILQGPANPLVNADKAAVGIQVNYLAGGGASNLPVRLRGRVQPKSVSFPDHEDYLFANGSVKPGLEKIGSEPWYAGEYQLAEADEEAPLQPEEKAAGGVALPTLSLQLDAAGAGQAEFTRLPKFTAPQDIQAELEYRDPNGETLTSSRRIPLWPSRVVVGLKPESWIASSANLKFDAVVLDLDGKPVPGVKVSVSALQREYYSHRRRQLGGFYSYENRSEIKALGDLCQGQTDSRGMLICEVKSPAAGNIILQASAADADGNESSANREVWVAGEDSGWFDASDHDRIDLLPEKKRYEPGETARFQVRMPFRETTALVTVEREGVMESFVTPVTRDNPVIEVPVKNNYAPNVFISAFVVRGRVQGVKPTAMIDLGKPAFKMGIAEINVGWAAHELKVRVATDKSVYRIREKAKVSVDVRRADGSPPPAGSEIALAAVDEGLLELWPNGSWQLLDAMMKRRGIEVSTSTAQMQVIGKRHFGRKALPAGGGGGRQAARELFDTLLFWQARVKLDDKGHAEVTVPLNDSLTSFRIVAVANGDWGLFGTGAASVQSTQDIMLLSGLPPVVREQDRYRAGFTLRNASERPIEVTLTASLDDGQKRRRGNALEPLNLKLAPGEAKETGWNITVPVGAEGLKWEVAVREHGKDEDADRLRLSQKVIPAVPVRTLQATIQQLEQPESISVKLPDGAIPGRGGVKISFRKHLSDGLGGVQEYMSRYPYTCFEQNASKAVALQDEAAWNALMKTLPAHMDQDGLVKYFPIMRQGDDALTAYVLSIANEAGYKIADDVRLRMYNGLVGFVEGRVIRYSALPTADMGIRKLAAIAALAREGEIDTKWLDSITIEPNLWPTSAVLDWLFILNRTPAIAGQPELMKQAQQIIRSRLNFQGTTMGFSTERNDALWWLMINGDVNANRVLLAFLDAADWRQDIPRLVQGTLARQQWGRWNTTVANAWGVLAMKKFSAGFEAAPVTGRSKAVLGGKRLVVDWEKSEQGTQKLLGWPASASSLELGHDGTGQPWATIQSMAALPLTQPLYTGYRIARRIIPLEQKNSGTWRKGDVVRIRLDIESQSDMTWVVVNDPVPAGASILGTGLGGDSKILTRDEKKQGWVWPAFEERTFDSFHAYYRFVPKGKMSVEYTLRLNNEGNFNLPPTRVEAMYAPEMFGELPNGNVVVAP